MPHSSPQFFFSCHCPPGAQVCAYALLDVLSKVVMSFVLLSGHEALSVPAPKEFS